MTAHYRTTAEVAAELRCHPKTVSRYAKRLGVGLNLGGPSGYRFNSADVAAIKAAFEPAPIPAKKRRRRAA